MEERIGAGERKTERERKFEKKKDRKLSKACWKTENLEGSAQNKTDPVKNRDR